MVISWCMRMEAKNSYFKKIARIGNFKNIPYSVAKRHQRLLCAYLQGQFFTHDELQCGPCEYIIIIIIIVGNYLHQPTYFLGKGANSLNEENLKEEILRLLPETGSDAVVSR